MICFPNGNRYKLVFIDNNIINSIAKNDRGITKQFILNYFNGDYMFVLSPFTLYEIYKSKGESREKIISFFEDIPLGVMSTAPQLVEFEKNDITHFDNRMILFAMGHKEIFKTQLTALLTEFSNCDFEKTLKKMWEINNVHVINMNNDRQASSKKWQNNYKKNMLYSMNKIYEVYDQKYQIKELGKYKSLEVAAYIRNQFIYNYSNLIKENSIIDILNASMLPYVDLFVTEKTVASWLKEAKLKMNYLSNINIIKLSDLIQY